MVNNFARLILTTGSVCLIVGCSPFKQASSSSSAATSPATEGLPLRTPPGLGVPPVTATPIVMPITGSPTPPPTATPDPTVNNFSLPLSGANQTSTPFGTGFQKFVYSASLPGPVNFTGLGGKVAIDSNSPYFSEALFTVGFAPGGSCPANGQSFTDYTVLFNTMPGAVILQQYIIKIVGGHLELPTNYTLRQPVAIHGCVFVILDGDAGAKGSVDTLTSAIQFNYSDATPDNSNQLTDAGGGEYCSGLAKGCNSSTTNQWRTAVLITGDQTLSSLTGSISAAPLYIKGSTKLPAGAWSVHNQFYLDQGCQGGAGNQSNQNFFGQIPGNAVPLFDVTQVSGGPDVAQQSVDQDLDVPVHVGDCLVQLLQTSGAGPIDIEVQMKANVGDAPSDPVVGVIDTVADNTVYGWACAQGLDQSIAVDLYAGPLGQGSFINETQATLTSDSAVAAACGASGTAYRFAYTFSADDQANFGGQSVYAYGISPTGEANNVLAGSGDNLI